MTDTTDTAIVINTDEKFTNEKFTNEKIINNITEMTNIDQPFILDDGWSFIFAPNGGLIYENIREIVNKLLSDDVKKLGEFIKFTNSLIHEPNDVIFKQRSEKAHGVRYGYILVDFMCRNTDVNIICASHGIFTIPSYSHMSGRKCPACVGRGRSSQSSTQLKFQDGNQSINRAMENCAAVSDCSAENCAAASSHSITKRSGKCVKHDIKEYLIDPLAIEHPLLNLNEFVYKGRDIMGRVFCGKCLETFDYTPRALLRSGCPFCAFTKPNTQAMKNNIIIEFGNIVDMTNSEYVNAKTTIEFGCNIDKTHGTFKKFYKDFMLGESCHRCRNKIMRTIGLLPNFNKYLASLSIRANPDLHMDLLTKYGKQIIAEIPRAADVEDAIVPIVSANTNAINSTNNFVNNSTIVIEDTPADVGVSESFTSAFTASHVSTVANIPTLSDIIGGVKIPDEVVRILDGLNINLFRGIVFDNLSDWRNPTLEILLHQVNLYKNHHNARASLLPENQEFRKRMEERGNVFLDLNFSPTIRDKRKNKIKVWCPIFSHGVWESNYADLYGGRTVCHYCSKHNTPEDLFRLNLWNTHHGRFVLTGPYTTTRNVVHVRCTTCGCSGTNKGYIVLEDNYKCSICAGTKAMKPEEYVRSADEMWNYHNQSLDHSETVYSGPTKSVTVKCLVHGYFNNIAKLHLNPSVGGCPQCRKK